MDLQQKKSIKCTVGDNHGHPVLPVIDAVCRLVHDARRAEHPRRRAELAVLARLDPVALKVDPVRSRRTAFIVNGFS